MKTPFDTALRVQRRALDDVRILLLAELAKQEGATVASLAIEDALAREATVAAGDWQCQAPAHDARLRARRNRIEDERFDLESSVDTLRSAALAACGQKQAVATAANGFARAHSRFQASAEQAQADDFAGTRIAIRSRSAPSMAYVR